MTKEKFLLLLTNCILKDLINSDKYCFKNTAMDGGKYETRCVVERSFINDSNPTAKPLKILKLYYKVQLLYCVAASFVIFKIEPCLPF